MVNISSADAQLAALAWANTQQISAISQAAHTFCNCCLKTTGQQMATRSTLRPIRLFPGQRQAHQFPNRLLWRYLGSAWPDWDSVGAGKCRNQFAVLHNKPRFRGVF